MKKEILSLAVTLDARKTELLRKVLFLSNNADRNLHLVANGTFGFYMTEEECKALMNVLHEEISTIDKQIEKL